MTTAATAQTPNSNPAPAETQAWSLRESQNAGINLETRWDRERGIVYNVVLLGRKSRNDGTEYADSAMQDAFKVVEQTGNYVDHPATENNNRSITENFGTFKGPYFNSAGELCAREFHYNVRNSFAPDFEWMLKNIPDRIGFSINADGFGKRKPDGTRICEGFSKVHSFDIVDDPATTQGIWNVRESVKKMRTTTFTIRESKSMGLEQTIQAGFAEIAGQVANGTLSDVKQVMSLVKKLFGLAEDTTGGGGESTEDKSVQEAVDKAPEHEKDMKAMEGASRSRYPYVRRLGLRLDEMKLRESTQKKAKEKEDVFNARLLKAKEKLTDDQISPVFREQLRTATTDADVETLINDRHQFAVREQTNRAPVSAPPTNGGTATPQQIGDLTKTYFG